MKLYTIDSYKYFSKELNEEYVEYLIETKYNEKWIKNQFNENEPLFLNKWFIIYINWITILKYQRYKLSKEFIRKYKKYVLSKCNSYFTNWDEDFLKEMWDEFKYNGNLLHTLQDTKNLSIEYIDEKFEEIIERNIFDNEFWCNEIWSNISKNLILNEIYQIKNKNLIKVLEYSKTNKELKYSDYCRLISE